MSESRPVIQGSERFCECGFAGTDVTPAGNCGVCGRAVDPEGERAGWAAHRALQESARGGDDAL